MAKRTRSQQAKASTPRRSIPRVVREARAQKTVLIGVAVVASIIVGLLAYAFINEQYIRPGRAVATVDGEAITVAQFKEQALFDYYIRTGGQPMASLGYEPSFFGQFSLDGMIEDLVFQRKAEELGVSVSEDEVNMRSWETLAQVYGLSSTPADFEPTATPSGPTPTPTPTSTFVYTPTPSPTPTLEPGVTPSPTPTATPEATATESETPVEGEGEPDAAEATATPTGEDAASAEDSIYTAEIMDPIATQFFEQSAIMTGLTVERFEELWDQEMYMAVLRDKLTDALDIEVDQTKELVHAAHLLVATEEEALDALARIESGEEFEVVAAEVSVDTGNAYKGGDLGWFGLGNMVAEFEEVAFAIPVGEISDPVETQFGWHLIKVYDRKEVPTSEYEQDLQRSQEFDQISVGWRDEFDIEIEDSAWQNNLPEFP